MFLITTDILEKLICDKCKKYLSVPPVKVYPDKTIRCGRCSKENDYGVVSLYDNIVRQGLFRCINRYDGCKEVLRYSEVSSHENICKSRLYLCPNCCSLGMPSFLLVNHFKEYHQEYFLKKSSFSIDMKSFSVGQVNYLYIKRDNLFVICVSITKNRLGLNAYHIGDKHLTGEITQKFNISSFDGITFKKYNTETQPCCVYEGINIKNGFTINRNPSNRYIDVDINLKTINVQKLMLIPTSYAVEAAENHQYQNPLNSTVCDLVNRLYVTEEFKKMWSPQYYFPTSGNFFVNVNNKILKCCSFCHNKFMFFSSTQSLYKCTGNCSSNCGTFICSSCYFFGIRKCDNEKDYEFAPEETAIFCSVKYFCKWQCGEKYCSWNLREHEDRCDHQKEFKCPLEKCDFISKLSESKKHISGHDSIAFFDGHAFELNTLKTCRTYLMKNEIVISVLNCFVSLKWKKLIDKYVFSMRMNCCKNKYPVAVVNHDGKIDIFTQLFVLDMQKSPKMLIILKDF